MEIGSVYTFGRDKDSQSDKFITCELLSISKEQFTFEAIAKDGLNGEPCLKMSFLSKASTIINGIKYKCGKDKSPVIEKFLDIKLSISFRDPDHKITISWIPVKLVAGNMDLSSRIKNLSEKYDFSICEDLSGEAIITTGEVDEKVKALAPNMKILNIKWMEELQGSNEDFLDEKYMEKYEIELPTEKKRPLELVTETMEPEVAETQQSSQRRRKRVKVSKPAFEDLFLFTPMGPEESQVKDTVVEPFEIEENSTRATPTTDAHANDTPTHPSITQSVDSETQMPERQTEEVIPDSDTESSPISLVEETKHDESILVQTSKRKITLSQMKQDDTEIKMEDPEPKKRKLNTNVEFIRAIQATKKEGEDRTNDLSMGDIDEEDIKNRIDDLLIIETFEVRPRPKASEVDNSQKYAGRKNFKTFKKAKKSTQKEIIPLEALPEPKYIPKYQEEEYEEAYLASQFNQISGFDPEVQQPGQFFNDESGMKSNDIFVGDESQSQMLEVPSNRPSPRKSRQRPKPTYTDMDDDEDDDDDDEDSELPRFTFKPT